MPKDAEILAIGSELLTPQRVDTNSLIVTEHLNLLGVEVTAKHIIGDDRDRLSAAIRTAIDRSHIVVLIGGLDALTNGRASREGSNLDVSGSLSWISVVLLVATLVLMTVQFAQVYGGHLPQHAPTQLPAGVLGLDGWADRLIVLSNCLWVFVAAWQAMKLSGQKS